MVESTTWNLNLHVQKWAQSIVQSADNPIRGVEQYEKPDPALEGRQLRAACRIQSDPGFKLSDNQTISGRSLWVRLYDAARMHDRL